MRDKYILLLVIIFLATIPFINPYIRGDGNYYYAYLSSLIVDGDLDFFNEYGRANIKFRENREIFERNRIGTGYLPNPVAPGTALLWSPFFLLAHLVVKTFNLFGMRIVADGFSFPYRWSVSFASALYGFLGLVFSYRICRKYFDAKISFFVIVLIWFGSSLPVYMYLLPAYAHATSLFSTSIFIYFWFKTRERRNTLQWFIFGLLGGLMPLVRYETSIFLLIPMFEWIRAMTKSDNKMNRTILAGLPIFFVGVFISLIPNFVVKYIIYGSPLATGYTIKGYLSSPKLFQLFFSSKHGLFTWTPIIFLANVGLVFFYKKNRFLLIVLSILYLLLACIISSRQWWQASSFGIRGLIPCTLLFVLGLASLVEKIKNWIPLKVMAVIGIFMIVWNAFFIFQFGWGLIPREDYISWRKMMYNQIFVVSPEIIKIAKIYLFERENFKVLIEEREAIHREKGLQY